MIINAVKMIFMERIWPCSTAHPPTAIPQSSLVCLRRPTSCLSKKDFQSLYAQPHEQTKGNNVEQWRALVPQVKKQFNISSYKCFTVYFSTSSCPITCAPPPALHFLCFVHHYCSVFVYVPPAAFSIQSSRCAHRQNIFVTGRVGELQSSNFLFFSCITRPSSTLLSLPSAPQFFPPYPLFVGFACCSLCLPVTGFNLTMQGPMRFFPACATLFALVRSSQLLSSWL